MDSKNCRKLGIFYHILTDNYLLLKKLDFRKERVQALAIKGKLEKVLAAIEKMFCMKILVRNRQDPFAEVYAENKMKPPKNETMIIDLEKQMEFVCAEYRKCGLESWADDIEKARERLLALGKDTKRQIAHELQEGAIMIFMPGRSTQYERVKETSLKKLRPLLKDNGTIQRETVGVYLGSVFVEALHEIVEQETVYIPEAPYLILIKPTQGVALAGMSVENEIKEIQEKNRMREQAKLLPVVAIMPPEYAALQKFFTEIAAMELQGRFKNISPLDANTKTRFIAMNVVLNQFDFLGCWSPWYLVRGTHALSYEVEDFRSSDTTSHIGVRLVSRIELK